MCSEDEDLVGSSSEKSENNVVTLGELTEYENAKWRIPRTKSCPAKRCNVKCKTHKNLVKHYQKNHAALAVLCKICDNPIMLGGNHNHLRTHYSRKHPNQPVPEKVKHRRHNCQFCEATFQSYFTMSSHVKNIHGRGQSTETKRTKNKNQKNVATRNTAASNSKDEREPAQDSCSKSSSWTDISEASDANTEPIVNSTRELKGVLKTVKRVKIQQNDSSSLSRLVQQKARSFIPKQKAHGRAPPGKCPFCNRYFTKSSTLIQHVRNHTSRPQLKRVKPRKVKTKKYDASNEDENNANDIGDQEQHQGQVQDEEVATVIASSTGSSMSNFNGFEEDVGRSNKPAVVILQQVVIKPADKARKVNTYTQEEKDSVNNSIPHTSSCSASVSGAMKTATSNSIRPKYKKQQTDQVANDATENDFVTIGRLTEYDISQWPFPNTDKCPRNYCKQKFKSRAEAMEHYIKKHADYDVLCPECGTLVALTGGSNMINHYKRMHKNLSPPEKKQINHTCQFCQKVLSSGQLRVHIATVHSSEHIDKSITVNLRTNPQEKYNKKNDGLNSIRKRKRIDYARLINHEMKKRKPTENKSVASLDEHMASLDDLTPRMSSVKITPSSEDEEMGSTNSSLNSLNSSETVVTTTSQRVSTVNDPQMEIDSTPHVAVSTNESIPKATTTRQSARSTGVRNKACTICGQNLKSFLIACQHYQRTHGRNVIICPYCEAYFLHSHLLTKHVLTKHNSGSHHDPVKMDANDSRTFEEETDENGPTNEIIENGPETQTDETVVDDTPIEPNLPFVDEPNEEPLNLSIRNNDEPLDLSMHK